MSHFPPNILISIVMPVRNGERFIARALDSVFADYTGSLEVIVVDGASTDGTLEVVKRYRDRIGTIVSEPDRGLYDAINKGIRLAKGQLIKILNADDEIMPGAIEAARAVYLLSRSTDHDKKIIVYGALDIVGDDGKTLAQWTFRDRAFYLPPYFPFLHPSWFVSRSVYEQIGLYDEAFRISGDREYFFRCIKGGVHFAYIGASMARFYTGGMSSNFGGQKETFLIHRRALSLPRAVYIAFFQRTKQYLRRLEAALRALIP